MSNITLQYKCIQQSAICLHISGSKSISQRALIINELAGFNNDFNNLSNSNDTAILLNVLSSSNSTVNLFNSGTSLRFLIALFAIKNLPVHIKGDKYLFTRPIDLLLNYLNQLGANIEKKDASILIEKGNLQGGVLKLDLMNTSQFVTALLLIGPYLKNGLRLHLPHEVNSYSYIDMTLSMMKYCGINVKVFDNIINVPESNYLQPYSFIESDWSSVSYIYVVFLFSNLNHLVLSSFIKNSIQPDSNLVDFFNRFGVITDYSGDNMVLRKKAHFTVPKLMCWDFNNTPDLFPTILIVCCGLRVELFATGLDTLPYKESNRMISMQKELRKFHADLIIDDNDKAHLICHNLPRKNELIIIDTHNDHRIALAFSTLVFLGFIIEIKNHAVINKSYPNFFNDLVKFGVLIRK